MNISRSIILGNKVGGTLTVMDNAQVTLGTKTADGHVNMCYASAYNGDPSYLNLDGGTLTTKMVTYGSGTSGNAFVTFNGGTLKANQATTTFIDNKARLFAKVAAGGGTIDSAGFAITIPAALTSGVAAGETDGGMTFKGGGTVTLSGANTYTGATVIDAGTMLQMPAANNLAGNIVVTNATFADCPITVLTLTNGRLPDYGSHSDGQRRGRERHSRALQPRGGCARHGRADGRRCVGDGCSQGVRSRIRPADL